MNYFEICCLATKAEIYLKNEYHSWCLAKSKEINVKYISAQNAKCWTRKACSSSFLWSHANTFLTVWNYFQIVSDHHVCLFSCYFSQDLKKLLTIKKEHHVSMNVWKAGFAQLVLFLRSAILSRRLGLGLVASRLATNYQWWWWLVFKTRSLVLFPLSF